MKGAMTSAAILIIIAAKLQLGSSNTASCPALTLWDPSKNECQCFKDDFHQRITECSEFRTAINYYTCATYDASQSQAPLIGECPFNSLKVHFTRRVSTYLPVTNANLTSFMCDALNRTGVLCSLCKPGLGPALLNYSHPCLECTRIGGLWYVVVTFVPATFFFIVIVVFHIDAASPDLAFIVLYSQVLLTLFQQNPNILHKSNSYSKILSPLMASILTSYGIWNLDFFRLLIPSFCASSEMSMLSVLALEYVVAVYPLLFTAIVYTVIELHARGCRLLNRLWRPFNFLFYHFRKGCKIRGSVINAFATFTALSYTKTLLTSFNLMRSTKIYSAEESYFTNKSFLFFNSSIAQFESESIYYFVLGATMLTVFCILPLLTLFLFHSRLCKPLHQVKLLCEVVKVFQKHYKDGSGESRDYRYFSGLFFALRILYIVCSYYLGVSTSYSFIFLILLSTTVLLAYIQPYKESWYNCLDSFWFALLTAVVFSLYQYQSSVGDNLVNIIIITIGIISPIIYTIVLFLYKLLKIKNLKLCWKLCATLKNLCLKKKADSKKDLLPDRLLNSEEYRPLLH